MDNYELMLYEGEELINKNQLLVVKSNSLMESKFHFKLWEMRLFEKMISLIKKGDKDFRACKIYMKDLIEYFDGNSRNDYKLIEEAALSLGDKKLFLPYKTKDGAKRWAKISIFPTVTIPHEEDRGGEYAYVELEFHHDLKPHLLDLKERFKVYDIRNIQHLRSIYSIRIFILLKQFEKIGARTIEVEVLKDLLGVDKDQYKLYADFKKRVILRPQKDLMDYCDICFDFQEEKIGRSVHSIRFIIKENQPDWLKKRKEIVGGRKKNKVIPSNEEEQEELTVEKIKVYNIVKDWGITKETLLEYYNLHTEEHIQVCIEETQNSKKVKNHAKYFASLIQKKNIVSSNKVVENQKNIKKIKEEELKKLKNQFEDELKKIKYEKHYAEQEIISKLLQDEELVKSVQEKLMINAYVKYDENLSFLENISRKSTKAFATNLFIKERSPEFEPIQIEFEEKERLLKNKFFKMEKELSLSF